MTELALRYSKEEFARHGQKIYDSVICPHVEASDEGKFVAVVIEPGLYEIDNDDYTATERLLAGQPHA